MVKTLFAAVVAVILLFSIPSMANGRGYHSGGWHGGGFHGGGWHGGGFHGGGWHAGYNGWHSGHGAWRGGGGYWYGTVWVPYVYPVPAYVCCDVWGRYYPVW